MRWRLTVSTLRLRLRRLTESNAAPRETVGYIMKQLVTPLIFAAVALAVIAFLPGRQSAAEPEAKDSVQNSLPVPEVAAQIKTYLESVPTQVASEDAYNE